MPALLSLRSLRSLYLAAAVAPVAAVASSLAAATDLGPFTTQADIGAPHHPGTASFDGKAFTVSAGGANMMDAHDEFHFVWRTLKGDFSISARIRFTGPGQEAHRKAGLMARAGLDDNAAYVDAAVHGIGPKALQVRRSDGGPTEMLVLAPPGTTTPKLVQLERHGARFTVTIREEGQPDVRRELDDASLPDTLYVGMFLCAHSLDATETGVFDHVLLTADTQ